MRLHSSKPVKPKLQKSKDDVDASMNNNAPVQAWIRVAVFNKPSPAQTLRGMLNKAGFTARLRDERKLQRYWFLTAPHASIYVEVPEESITAVKDHLSSHEETVLLLREAIRCPSCRSLRVEYPQMTRKNILPTLVAHALVMTHLMEPEYYCEECHYTWSVRRQRPRASRRRSQKKSPTLNASGTIVQKLSHAVPRE